jgi:hypothetical protein
MEEKASLSKTQTVFKILAIATVILPLLAYLGALVYHQLNKNFFYTSEKFKADFLSNCNQFYKSDQKLGLIKDMIKSPLLESVPLYEPGPANKVISLIGILKFCLFVKNLELLKSFVNSSCFNKIGSNSIWYEISYLSLYWLQSVAYNQKTRNEAKEFLLEFFLTPQGREILTNGPSGGSTLKQVLYSIHRYNPELLVELENRSLLNQPEIEYIAELRAPAPPSPSAHLPGSSRGRCDEPTSRFQEPLATNLLTTCQQRYRAQQQILV